MKTNEVISSPTNFLVQPYKPGLTIDFRQPAATSDLDKMRSAFHFSGFDAIEDDAAFKAKAGQMLVDLGIAENAADFAASLEAYSSQTRLDQQLTTCLNKLGVSERPRSRSHALELLLTATHCMAKAAHHPVRLHCHAPEELTHLEAGATHYGYVLDGSCTATDHVRKIELTPNTFFSISGQSVISGAGRCTIITHFGFRGITQFGGEVEAWGRLNYIDGCTDTLLVPPLKKGDPCYNALYFPSGTEQTQHLHPSLRCGVVIAGEGICNTPLGSHPMAKGSIFFLPPESYHSFHTAHKRSSGPSALTVVAFHPDSDFGPTDTDHPMINRTYFKFLHRLTSSERTADPVDAIA